MTRSALSKLVAVVAILGCVDGLVGSRLAACPFCSAQSQTLSEEIKGAAAVVIARYVGSTPAAAAEPAKPAAAPQENLTDKRSQFEIVKVLLGEKLLAGKKTVETLFFAEREPGATFLLIGQDPADLVWNTPVPLTPRGVEYVSRLPKLPEGGADRLAFFQDYLEDNEALLSSDAFDEFARAPYADVQGLKDRMNRKKLLTWIENPETSTSRRRLYLTMLGVCGQPEDVSTLERMIRSDDRNYRKSLDAMAACYITLHGAEGLPLIDELFLANAKAEYTDTYSAIMALRFLGQETTVVPRQRLSQSMRLILARPQLADLVIADLARWEDWTVIDDVAKLFKDANDSNSWVRVPVINYLQKCPLPEAKAKIEELAKIDPDAVRRANSSGFFPLGAATPPAGAQRPKEDAKDASTNKPAATAEKKSESAEPAKPAETENKKQTNVTPAGPLGAPTEIHVEQGSPATKVLTYAGGIGAALFATMFITLNGGQPRA
ncbi:MAG: HEAT repeat domain-containing protein [Planctomycetes bacterium]|nr:HEAT repeat domain-containing protein [Planctomycetota bacterium]